MPTANITNPSTLSPNITNDATYTVTWTTSGVVQMGSTWKLYISPAASISYSAISTSLPRLTTSFSWTKDTAASTVEKGLDEVATGAYIMKLTHTFRGSESTLDTQTFNMFRRFTSTITEAAIDVNDAAARNLGLKRTMTDAIDVNDAAARNSGFKLNVSEELDIFDSASLNKSLQRKVISPPILMESRLKMKPHVPRINKTVLSNYILVRDDINKKIIHKSHSGNTDFPMTDMKEFVFIKDYFTCRLKASTKRSFGSSVFLKDNLQILFIPYDQDLVYHIGYDVFTKFSTLELKEAKSLTHGQIKENINLLVTNSNKILKFPGDNITDKDGFIETKRLYLEKGVAQNLKVDYEGDLEMSVEAYPLEKDDSNLKSYPISNFTRNKWKGINSSIGRIRAVAFKLINIEKIKNFIVKYKKRTKE